MRNERGRCAHKWSSLCWVLSGLTAAWCNLNQLTGARGRPACRTGLGSWAGVQAHRNYHRLGFPVWQSPSESHVSYHGADLPVVCCSAATADGITSSILVCCWVAVKFSSGFSPSLLICFLGGRDFHLTLSFVAGLLISVAEHFNIFKCVPVFVYTEDIFGCTESCDWRFHHEQKQKRKRVLQPRCWGFNVHSTEAIPESKAHRLRSTGNRLVSVSTLSIFSQQPLVEIRVTFSNENISVVFSRN